MTRTDRRAARLALVLLGTAPAAPAGAGDVDLGPAEGKIRNHLELAGITLTDNLETIRERFPALSLRRVPAEGVAARLTVFQGHTRTVAPDHTRALTFVLTGPAGLYRIVEERAGRGVNCTAVFDDLTGANGPAGDSDDGYRRWQRVGLDHRETLTARCTDGRAAVAELDDPLILQAHARRVAAEREARERERSPKHAVPKPFR